LNILIVVWEKLVWKKQTNKRKNTEQLSKAVLTADGDGPANLPAGLTMPSVRARHQS
jgi:hypothetical protein